MVGPIITKPFSPILEAGVTELIGVDEQVDQNDYSGSVEVDVSPGSQPSSGVIRSMAFYETEDGTGALNDPAGTLYILDRHDRHILRAETDLRMVCVFTPPLTGNEVHDENGVYPLLTPSGGS